MTIETEFADVIDVIATSLGIAAERIFGVFVGAQLVIGIINIACVLISIALACLAWNVVQDICVCGGTDEDGNWKSENDEVAAWMFPVAAAIVVFVVAWILTYIIGGYVLKIACPDYTAMREIIRLVR